VCRRLAGAGAKLSGRKRILALVTDGFGGLGGTAAYARDALAAMTTHRAVGDVVALPRIVPAAVGQLPEGVTFDAAASRSTLAYLRHVARHVAGGRYDAVWASHIHLAPVALLAARRAGVRWGLTLHGVEGWTRSKRSLVSVAAERADLLLPVSEVTLGRFRASHPRFAGPAMISPGSVDLTRFTPGERPAALAARWGLAGRRVIMTLGRLDAGERAKGFDRVITVLPQLVRDIPEIAYLICGDGGDRARLEALATELGVRERVVFAGAIDEEDKVEYYRLADAFVLPSVMEGLGLVLLEAMACGVPTVASSADGGAEAVGSRGWVVDPHDPDALRAGIGAALCAPCRRPSGLDHFDLPASQRRMRDALDFLLGGEPGRDRQSSMNGMT
jgi:phosphatidylinositol alpha-1,6-mannosyltransferase